MTEYKPPKGTRDSLPKNEYLRQKIISEIETVFKTCNSERIDTPAFEIRDILMKKYGDDCNKQIFDIKNNENGESYALRYDLTVPFSRFIKTNGIKKIRRYQIGKVWRKDQPNIKYGRFREFYQCDFDILGSESEQELVNAETLSIIVSVLNKLSKYPGFGTFTIRINSRLFLESLFNFCKIPLTLFSTICSSMDKLDKYDWKYVQSEMLCKGLNEQMVEELYKNLKKYRKKNLDISEVPFISKSSRFSFLKMYNYLKILCPQDIDKFKLDFTLARGLDYYTGLIFEVNIDKKKIGSIVGGGRYNNLCDIDCVGFSIGIDRIMSVIKPIRKREMAINVWIIQVNSDNTSTETKQNLFNYRLYVLSKLRSSEISCGTEMRINTGLGPQVKYAVKKKEIPFIIFVGENEMSNMSVTLKNLDTREQKELSIDDCITLLKR